MCISPGLKKNRRRTNAVDSVTARRLLLQSLGLWAVNRTNGSGTLLQLPRQEVQVGTTEGRPPIAGGEPYAIASNGDQVADGSVRDGVGATASAVRVSDMDINASELFGHDHHQDCSSAGCFVVVVAKQEPADDDAADPDCDDSSEHATAKYCLREISAAMPAAIQPAMPSTSPVFLAPGREFVKTANFHHVLASNRMPGRTEAPSHDDRSNAATATSMRLRNVPMRVQTTSKHAPARRAVQRVTISRRQLESLRLGIVQVAQGRDTALSRSTQRLLEAVSRHRNATQLQESGPCRCRACALWAHAMNQIMPPQSPDQATSVVNRTCNRTP